MQNALRSAIAGRHCSCDWTVDDAGWVVMLLSLEEQTFSGRTREEALAISHSKGGPRVAAIAARDQRF